MTFFIALIGLVVYWFFRSAVCYSTIRHENILFAAYRFVKSVVLSNVTMAKQIFIFYFLFIFLFILLGNFLGMVPFSFTITSHLSVTFFLSLSFFIGLNIIGFRIHGWKLFNLFLPTGVPLAITPLLVLVEAISYIARIFSLSIRLFANMMAGHTLLKILSSFVWILIQKISLTLIIVALVPCVVVLLVIGLELAISFLQAYVFLVLMTLYFNDVLNIH